MNKIEIYKKSIEKWGKGLQILMLHEEMAELQKETCKELRDKGDIVKLAEEVADVEIMLEQVKFMLKINQLVEESKIGKLKRLEEILDGEENKNNNLS